MISDTGDGPTVLYGHQLAILLSFLDEIPQLRKLSKELLPLGVRQLIKAACLQGNSAAVSININLLAPNNDQATPPPMVPSNSGHSSPGQRNVSGEAEDLQGQQPRRRRRNSCSRGAVPYAPAAEVWRRRRNPRIRGGGTLEEVVAELGVANLDSLTHNPRNWANVIATSATCPISSHRPGCSFREVLEQCIMQGHDDVALSFQTMIAQIKLVVNIQW
jgi:hypothetical protein